MAQAGMRAAAASAPAPSQDKPGQRQDSYGLWRIWADYLRPPIVDQGSGTSAANDWAQVLVQTCQPNIPALLRLGLLPVHMHATGAHGARPTSYVSCLIEASKVEGLLDRAGLPDSPILRCELVAPRTRRRLGVSSSPASPGSAASAGAAAQRALPSATDTLDDLIARVSQALTAQPPVPPENRGGDSRRSKQGTRRCPAEPLVCVIDDRPNAHSVALAGNAGQRLGSIWHQGGEPETMRLLDAAKAEWGAAMHFGPVSPSGPQLDGAWLGRRKTPSAVAKGGAGDSVGEPSVQSYRRQVVQWPPPATSHGSAVLDLISGTTLWTGHRPGNPLALARRVTTRQPPRQVHFVQLPIPTVLDTAGGSLAAYVLDGIHDALHQAQEGQDVIVNVSFGTHSGGHDGTSMLEGAMRELLDLYDGTDAAQGKTLHIVLPAGNSHLWRCHAMGRLRGDATDARARMHQLQWKIQPDTQGESFMELWLPEDAELTLKLTAPDGSTSMLKVDPTKPGFELHETADGEKLYGAMMAPRLPTQGLHGRMVLIVVRGTTQPNAPIEPRFVDLSMSGGPAFEQLTGFWPRKLKSELGLRHAASVTLSTSQGTSQPKGGKPLPAPHGIWSLELSATGKTEVPFHAWIQRGDAAPLRGRSSRGFGGRQSYFLDSPDAGVDPRFTLNGIATFTHERLFVVGAMRRHDHCPSRYSAAGPGRGDLQRCEGPDIVVHADDSQALPGLLVAGFHGGARYRVSGTSMAAAVVTRHLYEHLAGCAKADSFRHWPYQDEACRTAGTDGVCQDRRSEEEPEHAHPLYRGLGRRAVPNKPDGSL